MIKREKVMRENKGKEKGIGFRIQRALYTGVSKEFGLNLVKYKELLKVSQ